ncbi:alpha/beta fold hydrolase [Pyxidicoccus xibeiensis]|uniref:alpha/beta fold hydrolase n=1 Tax=Pyxidicoccus xibeiensis TaxID=2906759 RepID=UPI0020A6EB5B|nr:alpha/beta hydrolase [Pyxidicoccus xibeiensis]MCP3138255.1 alpha/beta hydrolase [Pyxidicoccus xibeiensis]
MRRREFMELTAGALMAGALAGCTSRVAGGGTSPRGAGTVSPLDAAAFRAERRFARTDFGRIAYVERGAGDAALFLHGFPLNSFQWRGALERLSPHRRCVAPDFLSMGYTEVADGQSVAPDAQVAMLVALLDTLSIRTVDLVANDSGGAVAQLLVTRHPERVRTLLLTNCDEEHDSPPPALMPVIELAKAGKWVDEWLVPWRADKALARSAQGIGGMCYADPAHPTDEAIEYYFAPLVGSPRGKALAHAYAAALERNPLEGIAPALARCKVPARIVWGTGDTLFSPDSPGYLDRAFGNSRGVRRLEGSKLFWPEERPDVIAEEARRLWGVG